VIPNLRRLKITSKYDIRTVELLDRLFDHNVLFSLTKFTLLGIVSGPDVVHNLLSMLHPQCLYVLNVIWFVQTVVSLSNTSAILLDTFRQLKGRIPIELELSLGYDRYSIRALTVPRIDKSLCGYSYLDKNIVTGYVSSSVFFLTTNSVYKCRQSHWLSIVPALNNRMVCVNEIIMDGSNSKSNDEFLSYLSTIVSLHQITSLMIDDPFDLCQLRLLLSKMIHLRTLDLTFYFNDEFDDDSNKQNVINFFNDTSLCNILMSNGLQQLNLYIDWEYPDMIGIASLIVKRLSNLQIIELRGRNDRVPETLHILINGPAKLNFITVDGGLQCAKHKRSKMRYLRKNTTRAYRIEHHNRPGHMKMLYVWL
jgi:hypothetical protein